MKPRKKSHKPIVGGHARHDGKPNRVEKRAARRAEHRAVAESMRDPRSNERPKQTRPMKNPEDLDSVIEAVATGSTLSGVLREMGLSFKQFYEALEACSDGRAKYRRARELQAEAWGDEIVAISDEEITSYEIPGAASAEVSHRTLRVNTRKWLMGKINPQFADKSTMVHKGDPQEPIATEDVSGLSAEQRAERYQQTLKRMRGES